VSLGRVECERFLHLSASETARKAEASPQMTRRAYTPNDFCAA
jgi:hypothetical protein